MLFVVEYSTFNIQAVSTFGSGVTGLPYVENVNDSVPNPANTSLDNYYSPLETQRTNLETLGYSCSQLTA